MLRRDTYTVISVIIFKFCQKATGYERYVLSNFSRQSKFLTVFEKVSHCHKRGPAPSERWKTSIAISLVRSNDSYKIGPALSERWTTSISVSLMRSNDCHRCLVGIRILRTPSRAYNNTCIHTCIYVCIYIYMYVYMHVFEHAHVHLAMLII